MQACLLAPLPPLLAPPDFWRTSVLGGWVLPLSPPPLGRGRRSCTPPAPPRCWVFPPLLLLRCGDVEPRPGPMRVALANVTSLRLRWHTVADWRVDIVLVSNTRLMAVAQQVMRAQAGASGWQAFWGAPLESRGGVSGMHRQGARVGWVSWYAKASRPSKFSPPRGRPEPKRTPSPKPYGTPPAGATSW